MAVDVDVKNSRIRLEDRWWPACTLLVPGDQPELKRHWGGACALGLDHITVYEYQWVIPMENGLLVVLNEHRYDTAYRYELTLHSRVCEPDIDDDEWWGPIIVSSRGRDCWRWQADRARQGRWHWDDAEPEWINEHIPRLSLLTQPDLSGPVVELLRLERSVELDEQWFEEVRRNHRARGSAA